MVAAAALLASACVQGFEPIKAPARVVVVDDSIGGDEIALLRVVADEWNGARSGAVVSVARGRRTAGCGAIYVSRLHDDTGKECSAAGAGCSTSDGCTAEVRLLAPSVWGDASYITTAKHEIGHAFLGEEHSDTTGDIMSLGDETREISASEAARVRMR
jgi:hypothetical protein